MCAFHLDFELARAAHIIAKDMLKVRAGENVLIMGDSLSDWNLIKATAVAVRAAGGDPLVFLMEARPNANSEPPRPLADAMKSSDAVCDFAKMYMIHTKSYEEAYMKGVRILVLVGMDSDMAIRCIGKVNYVAMSKLGEELSDITAKAKSMKIVTPAGTEITFENGGRPVFHHSGIMEYSPGSYSIQRAVSIDFLGGQVSWIPMEETLNGVVVIDGSMWPPDSLGVLRNPIKLRIAKGKIAEIKGGREATILSDWLKSFKDEGMFNVSHLCYGFNPGAKLTGNMLEDERVYGVSEWGFGNQAPVLKGKAGRAAAHTDGIALRPSVWADEIQIERDGQYLLKNALEVASISS